MLRTRRIQKVLRRIERKFFTLFALRSPYRFLVRKWDGINDIELAARVLSTEFFSGELIPVPLPVDRLESFLIIAPHQDDETIGAGGTLLLAAAAGAKINVLYLTDGVQLGGPYSLEESARVRDLEAQEACAMVNARIDRLGLWNPVPKPTIEHLDRLSYLIRHVNPQVIMVPWLLDGAAKHRVVNHLLWLADCRRAFPDCEVWGYQVHNTLYPNGYVDITEVAEQKRKMLACYRSQNEHFQRYDHLAMGVGAWNSRFLPLKAGRSKPRYVEVFFTLPLREHLRLVEAFYFKNMEQTYQGHGEVLPGMCNIHRAVVKNVMERA